jgi:hypothetical protein
MAEASTVIRFAGHSGAILIDSAWGTGDSPEYRKEEPWVDLPNSG